MTMNNDKNLSKFLSLILRHKPETVGIKLDENGWANVEELLRGIKNIGRTIDFATLEKVVRENDKQRFSFNDDKTKIRANQGHSIQVDVELENADGLPLTVTFLVSDNDIAFRYSLTRAKQKDRFSAVITAEATSFNFPDAATSFICPQSKPMVGFAATKPSYEEEYKADAPLNQRSAFGDGYTFPCLFHRQRRLGACQRDRYGQQLLRYPPERL